MFIWPYFTLRAGRLVDEDGVVCFLSAPLFATSAEAEAWLEEQDERGSVR